MQDLDKLSVDSSVEEIRAMIYGVRKEAGLPEPEASQLDIVQGAMANRKPLDASMFETGRDYKRRGHVLLALSVTAETLTLLLLCVFLVGACVAPTMLPHGALIVFLKVDIGALLICLAAHKALRIAGMRYLRKAISGAAQ